MGILGAVEEFLIEEYPKAFTAEELAREALDFLEETASIEERERIIEQDIGVLIVSEKANAKHLEDNGGETYYRAAKVEQEDN